MLDRLARGPATVTQLAQPLPMTLAAVVQHVHVLESTGLISTSKVGRVRTCTLRHSQLAAAEQWFAGQRSAWERRLDRLGTVLDEGESR